MPIVRTQTPTEEVVTLPVGGSFVITDEVGTELFRVTATGDAVKVAGITVTPALQTVLNAVTATAAEINALAGQGAVAADIAKLHAITVAAAALNLAPTGVAAGYKLARGETALDGGNPTPVATGLTTVIAFAATLKGTAAPGDSTSVLSANVAGAAGNVDVYAWKHTTGGAAGNPTLIASTGTESFYWLAVGT